MAGDRRATARQPDQPPRAWRRCCRPTATAASPSPARPGRPWRWSSSSSCSSSTTRRSRARALSLEGKANQLSMMVRGNLPAAMQGLVVVPLFAGYDLRRRTGPAVHLRRHRRPLRGARLRRHRLGQPARRHRHQARLPRRASSRDDAVDLAVQGAVRGGRRGLGHRRPRPVRGIYPIVATITADGFAAASTTTSSATALRGARASRASRHAR